MMHPLTPAGACLLGLLCVANAAAAGPVAGLAGAYRDGQVFLTWREAETPAGTTFNVYIHDRPITAATLGEARRIGHHVERHSARDWWQDPASFDPDAAPGAPAGFRIRTGAAPLDPSGGLFVHTVTAETAGPRYYAVTSTGPDGLEEKLLTAGANALAEPVSGQVAPVGVIWEGQGPAPAAGAGQGKGLILSLHGRGGGATAGARAQLVDCLMFGGARQGWREGLPFKFRLATSGDLVRITPCDRIWAGRPVKESPDRRDHCPAVSTFWFGYNERIYETTHTGKVVAPNYTEEQLLGMVRWAQQYLGTDPNRTYVTGGSMGGSGSVSMCLHYPQVFAAAVASVPVVSYTRRGRAPGSLVRLECACGPIDETSVDGAGNPLLQWMNGEWQMQRAAGDLPYLFITNGRTDGSIPWQNNPPFYRAALAARQGLSVYWNNEGHADVDRLCPEDVKGWIGRLSRFALNRSFPVFTHCSDDRDPGSGDPKEGDITGWINRGLDWKDVQDTPREYAITLMAVYPDARLPVTVDVTLRRLQQFRVKPGEEVQVTVGQAAPVSLRADAAGLLTVRAVKIEDAAGTRVVFRR